MSFLFSNHASLVSHYYHILGLLYFGNLSQLGETLSFSTVGERDFIFAFLDGVGSVLLEDCLFTALLVLCL